MTDGSKTPNGKRDSLKALRYDLGAITSRLQAANHATENSVESLKTALHALAQHGDKDSLAAQERHAALERQISTLQSHLTARVRDTQKAINTDLKAVLDDPRLSTLAQAIDSADTRLRKTETEQAQNLARLQGYIANLAREVDINLGQERKARQTAVASLNTKQNQFQSSLDTQSAAINDHAAALKAQAAQLKSVETDTSTALRDMGEKIAVFAQTAVETRREQQTEIKTTISDIALETQRNFDLYRERLDRDIEAMQAAHEAEKRDFTQDLENLKTRLETLEFGMSPIAAAPSLAVEDAFTPPADPQDSFKPYGADIVESQTPPPSSEDILPQGSAEDDAFTSHISYDPIAPAPNSPAPNSPIPNSQSDNQSANPYAHIETGHDPYYHTPATAAASMQDRPALELSSPYGPVESHIALPLTEPISEALYDNMPYADPAYAETQPTMEQARPGGPVNKKTSRKKRSAMFTPSNLRAAVLGVAVLGGSYFVYNKVIGATSAPGDSLPDNVFVESSPTSDLVADNSNSTVPNKTSIETLEPIGNYPEDLNRPINDTNTAQSALEAAAAEGNDIAEYQLGLIKLQNGDVNTALELLRNAANKGQPAAQYRLAKLYETGNGVTKDLLTAKDLIEKSARSGNRIAMHDLANFYANGIGGAEQDLTIAAKWFEKAAERGVVDSQYNAGYLYEFGFGVTKNLVEAYVWYGIAAKQGDTEATRRITLLNKTLSDVEIENAKKRIDGFKPVKPNQTANGIFENLPWQTQNKNPNQDGQIAQAQSLLNSLGYSVGAADGQVGAQTRSAVIAFEKANGLPETGRINTVLLEQLELAAGA